jgi:hypothetical protein
MATASLLDRRFLHSARIAKCRACWQNDSVKTLAEVERAAEKLSPAKQTELLYFLVQRLDAANLPLPEPRDFSDEQIQQWLDLDEEEMRKFKAGT